MSGAASSGYSFAGAWAVLSLFLIPIGGGIPAGVLHAKTLGMAWPITASIYFVSDVILACLFEPILWMVIAIGKRWDRVRRTTEIISLAMKKTIARYGHSTGPLTLIVIAFGADPMTGRAAAAAAGHGFVAGWLFAIAGDMIYFALLMVSTLWLNGILGDGTWTTIIILVLMLVIPWGIGKIRERKASAN